MGNTNTAVGIRGDGNRNNTTTITQHIQGGRAAPIPVDIQPVGRFRSSDTALTVVSIATNIAGVLSALLPGQIRQVFAGLLDAWHPTNRASSARLGVDWDKVSDVFHAVTAMERLALVFAAVLCCAGFMAWRLRSRVWRGILIELPVRGMFIYPVRRRLIRVSRIVAHCPTCGDRLVVGQGLFGRILATLGFGAGGVSTHTSVPVRCRRNREHVSRLDLAFPEDLMNDFDAKFE